MTREKAGSDARLEPKKKEATLSDDFFPPMSWTARKQGPGGPTPALPHHSITLLLCCQVPIFAWPFPLITFAPRARLTPTFRTTAITHRTPKPALRSPEPPTGAAGRGGAGGQADDYAEGPAGKAAAAPPGTHLPLAQHHRGGRVRRLLSAGPGVGFSAQPQMQPPLHYRDLSSYLNATTKTFLLR